MSIEERIAELIDKYEHEANRNQSEADLRAGYIDLLTPFRKFYYYHPLQRGSASLKRVLPALTGKGYEEMEIADGGQASVAFQTVTYGDVSEEERQKVRADLERYCALDTEGMIWIVDMLRKLCD